MIERQRAHFDPDAPIVAPVIRIERQSSTGGSGNKAANGNSDDHKVNIGKLLDANDIFRFES